MYIDDVLVTWLNEDLLLREKVSSMAASGSVLTKVRIFIHVRSVVSYVHNFAYHFVFYYSFALHMSVYIYIYIYVISSDYVEYVSVNSVGPYCPIII